MINMKKILIDKCKLKNNHDYDDLVNEMNSYNDPNFIPINEKAWEYRRKYFKDAKSIQVGNISAIIQPNSEITINQKGIKQLNHKVTYQDYTIQFFYKGVSIGHFSGFHKSLSFDRVLKDSDIIENNMSLILDIIPFDNFNIDYSIGYVDWNNRPFIID